MAWLLASQLCGCGGSADSSRAAPKSSAVAVSRRPAVLVFAAASLGYAINEIRRDFTTGRDIEVQTSFAASSTLAQQVVHGAEADIFLAADTNWVDFVAKKGFVDRRDNLLGNRLVIVVPADAKSVVNKPEDLLDESIRHVAIGEPEFVPAGKYARRALEKLGLWEKLQARFVPADDVRAALAYVETGAAEAGIVYASDAAGSTKVKKVYAFPSSLTGPIVYPAALLKHGANQAAAEDFFAYLHGDRAKTIFLKHGFTLLPADHVSGIPPASGRPAPDASVPSAAAAADAASSHPKASQP